jgi:hypothetical protein
MRAVSSIVTDTWRQRFLHNSECEVESNGDDGDTSAQAIRSPQVKRFLGIVTSESSRLFNKIYQSQDQLTSNQSLNITYNQARHPTSNPQPLQTPRHLLQRLLDLGILPRPTPRHLNMLHQPTKRLPIESALWTRIQVGNPSSVFGGVEVGVELFEVRKGDSRTEETGVFVRGVFAVFCRLEDGDGLEGIFFMSNDGGGRSGLSLR